MSIKVNVVAKSNPMKKDEAPKYYANAVHQDTMAVEELAKEIAKRCTLRESDVRGALVALMEVLPEEICNGRIVSFGDIGTFYVNVSSDGAATATELTQNCIRGSKVVFQPTKKLKKQLLMIDYSIPTVS